MLEAKLKVIDETHCFAPGKSALLVIDMQHGFIDEGASLEVAAAQDIIPNISGLIDACRPKGAPVIFTEFVYSDNVPCLRGDPFGIEHFLWMLKRPLKVWVLRGVGPGILDGGASFAAVSILPSLQITEPRGSRLFLCGIEG